MQGTLGRPLNSASSGLGRRVFPPFQKKNTDLARFPDHARDALTCKTGILTPLRGDGCEQCAM
jgi:hypothetical protein